MFERRTDDEVDGEQTGEGELDGPEPRPSEADAAESAGRSDEARADVAARREATKRRMDAAKGTDADADDGGTAKPKPGTAAARAARARSAGSSGAGSRKGGRSGGGRATADDPTGTRTRRNPPDSPRKVPRPSKRTGAAVDQKSARTKAARSGNPKKAGEAAEASRYTAPIPRSQIESPVWVPVLMFTLLGLGALVILLTYILWEGRPLSLGVGLALILGGILTATQYR